MLDSAVMTCTNLLLSCCYQGSQADFESEEASEGGQDWHEDHLELLCQEASLARMPSYLVYISVPLAPTLNSGYKDFVFFG